MISAIGRFFFSHKLNKHRDVKCIDCDNGKLRRIKAEFTEPGSFYKVCTVEVNKPCCNYYKTNNTWVRGHTWCRVNLLHKLNLGAHITYWKWIHTTDTTNKTTIECTKAGYWNKQIKNVAEYITEYIYESNRSALICILEYLNWGTTCNTNVIEKVNCNYNDTAYDKRNRKIFLFS